MLVEAFHLLDLTPEPSIQKQLLVTRILDVLEVGIRLRHFTPINVETLKNKIIHLEHVPNHIKHVFISIIDAQIQVGNLQP